MNKSPRAALFDLDGTLADTFPHIVDSVNAAVGLTMGKKWTAQEVVSRFGIPVVEMLERELPADQRERGIAAYLAHFEKEHRNAPLFDGVKEMLEKMRAKGIPMAIVTGRERSTSDITAKYHGWEGLFGCVVSGSEMEAQKPHPCGAFAAAKALGVAPEQCAFIGDTPADMLCGKNAGMTTIAAVWHAEYIEKLRPIKADYWAEKPGDVLRVFGID